ncbi:hypothetical protein [Pseudomonas tohonis]|nr:hypothetical protein [Pseudomonas tohonis]
MAITHLVVVGVAGWSGCSTRRPVFAGGGAMLRGEAFSQLSPGIGGERAAKS